MNGQTLSLRRRVYNRGMRALVWLCAGLTCALLVFLIGYIFCRGIPGLTWELLSGQTSYIKNTIGILPNILNTLYIILMAMVIVLPLGVGAAIYLTEYATNRRVIGVITTDDIVEAVDDAMGDDYAKLGGLTGEEDLHEPLKTSLKKRLPWLIILLFLGMGVSSVVGLFESVVSQVALIVCFQSSGMFGFCIVKPPFLCCVLSAYHNFARDASQPNPSSAAISSPCGVISTAIPSSSFPA